MNVEELLKRNAERDKLIMQGVVKAKMSGSVAGVKHLVNRGIDEETASRRIDQYMKGGKV